jgi:5-methylcytosine-specific restriction endonuclease McrA
MRRNPQAFLFLTCLRCGTRSVPVFIPLMAMQRHAADLMCGQRDCGARHYLAVKKGRVIYDRDTRKYLSEYYDDGLCCVVKCWGGRGSGTAVVSDNMYGPIIILLRKKRFSKTELRSIFERSCGRCQICKKRWKLADHGKTGWHVDHVVANSGGGSGTENMENLQVACAQCNLKKGRGYTFQQIRLELQQLVEILETNAPRGGKGSNRTRPKSRMS